MTTEAFSAPSAPSAPPEVVTSSSKSLHSSFIVDTIFPTQEIHLIAGASGAGKSTWMLKFIDGWSRGDSFFGYTAHPAPYVYLSLDRSLKGVHRIFERLKLSPASLPHYIPDFAKSQGDLGNMIRALHSADPSLKVFFIEGFQMGMPEGKINDNASVKAWLLRMRQLCEQLDITIVGVAQAAKVKTDAMYENPRQRISGAAAWAHYVETIVVIEQANPDSMDSVRRIWILPRNAPESVRDFEFVNGVLLEKAPSKSNFKKLVDYVLGLAPGTIVTTAQLLEATRLSKAALYVELAKPGFTFLKKAAHGSYEVILPDVQSTPSS